MRQRDGFAHMNHWLSQPINRRRFLQRTAWLGGLAALGSGHGIMPGPAAAATPKAVGTITIGKEANPDAFDPHRTSTLLAIKIHNNIYNGILKITYDGQNVWFKPDLAQYCSALLLHAPNAS